MQIVGTRSWDRIRLAMLDGGHGIHVLFERIFPGAQALHLEIQTEYSIEPNREFVFTRFLDYSLLNKRYIDQIRL